MSQSLAKASARDCSRLATAISSARSDARSPGISFSLILAVETIPHLTGSAIPLLSPIVEEIGVGMLGYAFMGKAHSNAFKKIAYITWPPPLMPRLVGIAGRDAEAVRDAAERFGYEDATGDWRHLVADERIGLFDNGGPNSLHAEPTIAAAEAGKHVICEKPLGRDAAESFDIWQRVAATGVKHLCAFNYRFVPAVRLAREMIEAG